MKPTSSLTGEDKTFHFALATGRYKDNRIPPKGFRIAEAAARLSVPVKGGIEDENLYTAAEYAGGYDDVSVTIPPGATFVEVGLYYQTTSREYIEFLRDEINGTGNLTLTGQGAGGDQPYLIQTDQSGFFDQLKAWGDTIWQLWTHNMNVTTAAPFQMAIATVGTSGGGCNAVAPNLVSATPGNSEVLLDWQASAGAAGYNVYYDQAGKSVLINDAGDVLTYLDLGLTNGTEYCYEVTSYTDATCESGFSNVICATPTNQGQSTMDAGVTEPLETGIWTGKGKTQTFTPQTTFSVGDEVTIQGTIVDQDGVPLEGATFDVLITGPESTLVTSGVSDASGLAEATWRTQAPRKNSPGTTPGDYTATIKGVTLNGYTWDAVETSTTITIQ